MMFFKKRNRQKWEIKAVYRGGAVTSEIAAPSLMGAVTIFLKLYPGADLISGHKVYELYW